MMLTVTTYKVNNKTGKAEHKEYRYPCFDSAIEFEGLEFEEKFNKAFNALEEEIVQDRMNNDMNVYSPITISNVFLS